MSGTRDVGLVLPLQRLPRRTTAPAVTVVVPTRNEAGNVVELVHRLGHALRHTCAEILFVDDSDDETPEIVRAAQASSALRIRLLHRARGERQGGLGGAVVMGLKAADAPWAVVMDGDLQHPPDLVPVLVAHGLQMDADVVVASRYCGDGDQNGLSGPVRVAVSGLATTVTKAVFRRELQDVTDPMTGFFAVKLTSLDLSSFRPLGFKILLELLVRADDPKVVELPFTFASRHAGESKASVAEGARFLRLVASLRVGSTVGTPLVRARLRRAGAFGLVGASGVLINSLLLWLLVSTAGLHYVAAAVLATEGASVWNFLWTERWVFAGPKPMSRAHRFLRFTALNNAAMLVSIPLMVLFVSFLGLHYVVANVLTTGLVFVARFLLSERWVYRSRGFVSLLRTRNPVEQSVLPKEVASA